MAQPGKLGIAVAQPGKLGIAVSQLGIVVAQLGLALMQNLVCTRTYVLIALYLFFHYFVKHSLPLEWSSDFLYKSVFIRTFHKLFIRNFYNTDFLLIHTKIVLKSSIKTELYQKY